MDNQLQARLQAQLILGSENLSDKTKKQLFADYAFLTRELEDFANTKHFDMFGDLLEQRDKVIALIAVAPDPDNYVGSGAYEELKQELLVAEKTLLNRVKFLMRQIEQRKTISSVYDVYAQSANTGYNINAKR